MKLKYKIIHVMVKQTTTTAPELHLNETHTAGYLEILPMTFDERVKMYMKLSKEELAKMLAERDRLGIDAPQRVVPCPYPVYPTYPSWPSYPEGPWVTYDTGFTTSCTADPNLKAYNSGKGK